MKDIFQKAADDLADKHPLVALGSNMSKVDLTGWAEAGDAHVKLPRNYSGCTDSNTQVILAKGKGLVKEVVDAASTGIRGLLSTDHDSLVEIARTRYPEEWTDVPFTASSKGLVMEGSDGKPIGYAILEPDQRYISDFAFAQGTPYPETLRFMRILEAEMRGHGTEWTADARESTSYKLLQLQARRKRLQILDQSMTDSMDGEPRYNVRFRLLP